MPVRASDSGEDRPAGKAAFVAGRVGGDRPWGGTPAALPDGRGPRREVDTSPGRWTMARSSSREERPG